MVTIELDLATVRTDIARDVTARQVLVLANPGDLEFRVDELAGDLIPAIPGLSLEADDEGAIYRLYFSNTAGVGSAVLLIVE